MNSALLALDLGTDTGWALRRGTGAVDYGTVSFSPARSDRDGLRFLRFRSWLHDLKRRLDVSGETLELIRYERVDFVRPGQVYAAHVYGAMWGTLTAWAEHHGIPYQGVAVSTLKKAVTGHGFSPKDAIIREIRRRGFDVQTSHEADALGLLLTAPQLARAA